MKAWSWILIIVLAVLIKLSSFYPDFVERYYSNGVYRLISKFLRVLFGWIPFSFGDLVYGFFGLVILIKTFQTGRALFRKKFSRQYFINGLKQIIFFFLFLSFLFFWRAPKSLFQIMKWQVATRNNWSFIKWQWINEWDVFGVHYQWSKTILCESR